MKIMSFSRANVGQTFQQPFYKVVPRHRGPQLQPRPAVCMPSTWPTLHHSSGLGRVVGTRGTNANMTHVLFALLFRPSPLSVDPRVLELLLAHMKLWQANFHLASMIKSHTLNSD